YTLGREAITTEDIEAICVEQTTGKIFQMVDNIAEKKQKQALQLYYDLITLRESPISILLLIARHFQILLQVKELSRQSNDTKFISAKAGIREFTVKKYLAQAQRFTIEALKNAITDCVQAQEDIQTGNMNNKMAVELLIIKYASGAVV
ncbi:MAG: DNA polymerase III subunit delta, partial [Lachnospiraceae bacterium]